MKFKLFFLLSIFAVNFCTAQMRPIIIIFKTGDTIRGVGKLKTKTVKYKDELNDLEPVEFEFSKIDLVKLVIPPNKSANYRFFKAEKDSSYVPYVEIVSGKEVSLYTTTSSGMSGFNNMNNGNSQAGIANVGGINVGSIITNFYVKKKNEEEVTLLGRRGTISHFEDRVLAYFADCELLVKKIKYKQLKIKYGDGLSEIVDFYNKNCVN